MKNRKEKERLDRSLSGGKDIQSLKGKTALYKLGFYAFLCLSIALFALCFYLGTLPKSQPWVIEVTQDGSATYYPDAVKLLSKWEPNDATTRYFLRDYVKNLREVSADNQRNYEQINLDFVRSTGDAGTKLRAYYNENNPFERSSIETVDLPDGEIAIAKYASNKWKVTWRESTYRVTNNSLKSDIQYEGIFTVAFYAPQTEDEKRLNPIGLYISDFDIARLRSLM